MLWDSQLLIIVLLVTTVQLELLELIIEFNAHQVLMQMILILEMFNNVSLVPQDITARLELLLPRYNV